MPTPFTIRRFTPADYEAVAELVAADPPDRLYDYEFRSAGEFRDLDESFAAVGQPLARYVAADVATGRVVGYAQHFEIGWSEPAGRYWLVLRVHPDARRRGVGAQLFARVEEDLARLDARAVVAELHESTGAQLEMLRRRGFREVLRSWPYTLEPRRCDLGRFAGAAARPAPLRIATLAEEQARDPDWLPRLYELYALVSREVPIPVHPLPRPPIAWLERQLVGLPISLPEACFVVRDGERYAGLSFLHRDAETPGLLQQKITAVRPEYRGRGLAVALKVRTIEFALRNGYSAIQTAVESNNPSMLAINERFGFVGGPGLIMCERARER
jgi:GNAT superfamily N-acetyltransferase